MANEVSEVKAESEREPEPTRLALVLMARRPAPGKVKSRLAEAVGDEAACEIYGAMAADTWQTMRSLGLPCYLATDGNGSAWLPGAARVLRQAHGSFGTRLMAVLGDMTHRGYRGAIALAADTPHLGARLIVRAADAVAAQEAQVVSYPVEDGGLALLGLDLPSPLDLEGLPWESARLDRALRERSDGLRSLRLGPALYDVDTLDDLRRLLGEPEGVRRRCPLTIACGRRALSGRRPVS